MRFLGAAATEEYFTLVSEKLAVFLQKRRVDAATEKSPEVNVQAAQISERSTTRGLCNFSSAPLPPWRSTAFSSYQTQKGFSTISPLLPFLPGERRQRRTRFLSFRRLLLCFPSSLTKIAKLFEDYIVENSTWLDKMYGLREKWALCYMKNTVTLGIRSTQVGESFNSDLKDYLRPTLDIVWFLRRFEGVVEDKRVNELKEEYDSKEKHPKTMGLKAPVLTQAGKIYTPAIFKCFFEEFNWAGVCTIKYRKDAGMMIEFIVGLVGDDGRGGRGAEEKSSKTRKPRSPLPSFSREEGEQRRNC